MRFSSAAAVADNLSGHREQHGSSAKGFPVMPAWWSPAVPECTAPLRPVARVSDLYNKIKEDVEFRREWAEKCGFGFKLSSVVPSVPKTEEKRRSTESRVSLFKLCEKEWSALRDDYRNFRVIGGECLDISV
ncbi:MAG: hypothetical protein WBG23_13370 [Acidobacteriaceae bacterium]